MKYSELQNKEIGELNEVLKELKVKLGKARFELANKTLKDFSEIQKIKKNVARTLTAIKSSNK
ncbi:MAG: 50S ribosomal protein L29 [Candidatus Paceibacterota bacterium]